MTNCFKFKLFLIHLYWRFFNKNKYRTYLIWSIVKKEIEERRKKHAKTKKIISYFKTITVAYDRNLKKWWRK